MTGHDAVLVTGGAGYIGSHAALALLRQGRRVIIYDDLSRGHARAVEAVAAAADQHAHLLHFERADLTDTARLQAVLMAHGVHAVLHFGALAYVGESVQRPLDYWRVNAGGTLSVLRACAGAGVQRLVYSSTCATYGEPPHDRVPIDEALAQRPINPYGASKLAGERMLLDHVASATQPGFACAMLRYFNVCGCDRAGQLGEHHEPETHLIPLAILHALGRRSGPIGIFGTDYPTPDGTAVRDYVHVEDLVGAHLSVLEALTPGQARVYNIGTGKGVSVRQVIDAVQRVSGHTLQVVHQPRRPGDPATLTADPSKIKRELGWQAQVQDVETMIESAWRWFQKHPRGYA
jgi:UDP-glucose 4-epimerase